MIQCSSAIQTGVARNWSLGISAGKPQHCDSQLYCPELDWSLLYFTLLYFTALDCKNAPLHTTLMLAAGLPPCTTIYCASQYSCCCFFCFRCYQYRIRLLCHVFILFINGTPQHSRKVTSELGNLFLFS